MKYIKIIGNLTEVLGNEARKMKANGSTGILIFGNGQMIKENETMISYGILTNEKKFDFIMNHPMVTFFLTKEDVNADIDNEFDDFKILTSIEELQLDMQLSGTPNIIGYNKNKPLKDKNNLKALINAGMGGIKTNRKAKHF